MMKQYKGYMIQSWNTKLRDLRTQLRHNFNLFIIKSLFELSWTEGLALCS